MVSLVFSFLTEAFSYSPLSHALHTGRPGAEDKMALDGHDGVAGMEFSQELIAGDHFVACKATSSREDEIYPPPRSWNIQPST